MTTSRSTPSFYGEDLARIHAEGFASYWDGAADWLAEIARAPRQTPYVVDVGCGDGRMLDKLNRRGIQGCGFDISESLVRAARERGLAVSVADATQLEVPEATLVIALGEVLAYRNENGDVALENIVCSAADSLVPGGYLVFDVTSPRMTDGATWSEGDGWFVASRTEIINEVHMERQITVFTCVEDSWRRTNEVHRLMLLDSARVDTLLERCGLVVDHAVSLGDTRLLPGRVAFIARKND